MGFDSAAGASVGDDDVATVFAEAKIRWEDAWGTASIGYIRSEDG